MGLRLGWRTGGLLREVLSLRPPARHLSVTPAAEKKTRWMPTAPSKLFRVPPRRQFSSPEEAELHKKTYNNYRTQMKSLMQYLRANWQQRQLSRAQPGHLLSPEQEETEHRQLMQLNDAENRRMAELRQQRLAEQAEEIRRRVERQHLEALVQQERDRETAVGIIAAQQEVSATYIPREGLQEAIEAALASQTDYNFAIDAQGNRIEGRTTPAP